MARITVEDCLEHVSNRFALVQLAAVRAKQLLEGDDPVTDERGNKAIVTALREIADGRVEFCALEQEVKEQIALQEEYDFETLTFLNSQKLE